MKTFQRLLIANRGEIACRIIRTARRMGLTSIVIYSDADRDTLAVELADEAYPIGPGAASLSYLDSAKVLQLASDVKAEAIHPGYGFLSEDSAFAREVLAAGLIWVGPTPESMDMVSSKSEAKILARAQNVPVSPGIEGLKSIQELQQAAHGIGYPVLLKATAGGGGRGIRKVFNDQELKDQFPLAQTEARNAFGNDELLLEKYLADAHHVEVQVFGDQTGNVIHLGERDCSAQRRHQKVIEEAPSPVLTPQLRQELLEAAVRLAKAAKYTNAGTVEFLVTPDKKFYFLEVNTRLQVEHPVTELITGLDLVEWQLRIARGESLPLKQEQIQFKGHAIQARLYAEDPFNQFRPQTGLIDGFSFPQNLRVDHFLTYRTSVSPFYDSMLAKLIVHASDRETARQQLVEALEQTLIGNLVTNRSYLQQILGSPFFIQGETLTQSLERTTFAPVPIKDEAVAYLHAAQALTELCHDHLQGWSNNPLHQASFALQLDSTPQLKTFSATELLERPIVTLVTQDGVALNHHGVDIVVKNLLHARQETESGSAIDVVKSPMDGTLIKLTVVNGENVELGQVLGIVEAMKMQFELRAPRAGVIAHSLAQAGQQVKNKQSIIQLKPT